MPSEGVVYTDGSTDKTNFIYIIVYCFKVIKSNVPNHLKSRLLEVIAPNVD